MLLLEHILSLRKLLLARLVLPLDLVALYRLVQDQLLDLACHMMLRLRRSRSLNRGVMVTIAASKALLAHSIQSATLRIGWMLYTLPMRLVEVVMIH